MIPEIKVQDNEDANTLSFVPNDEMEFTNAKMYLQTASKNTGDNL